MDGHGDVCGGLRLSCSTRVEASIVEYKCFGAKNILLALPVSSRGWVCAGFTRFHIAEKYIGVHTKINVDMYIYY